MKRKLFGILRSDRRGLALITVLGVVTLATILIVALFSLSDNELRSAKSYNDGASARLLADNAIELVKSQIQAAAEGDAAPGGSGRTSWSSQPGAVKTFRGGKFVMGRKLYSADNMIHTGAEVGTGGMNNPTADIPPAGWDTLTDEWVDLNAPVASTNATGAVGHSFPIVDPRIAAQPRIAPWAPGAALSGELPGATGPEGFEVTRPPGFTPSGISVPTTGNVPLTGSTNNRLPMPVRWLYILRDGSFCTLNQSGPQSPATYNVGSIPTPDNPIIGRVAFWTDDESCKININTAGEPTIWQVPNLFSERDYNWANNQPVYREFQRFPGHPATVAISSVLAPGFIADPTVVLGAGNKNNTFPTDILQFKEDIYEVQPKIATGGSLGGTRPFTPDDFSNSTAAVIPFATSVTQRLYSSVDEYVFTDLMTGNQRSVQTLNLPSGGNTLQADLVNARRFFLTAHSKAPEITMFGTPRVAIWPIPDISGGRGTWRTGWDESIAGVSNLGNADNTYYFSRRNAKSALIDMGEATGAAIPALKRNALLMGYLYTLMRQPIEGGNSFVDKYGGDDASQILVQIFDYIRCTNLYDAFLAQLYRKNNPQTLSPVAMQNFPTSVNESNVWNTAPADTQYYTYTAPRFFVNRNASHIQNMPPALGGQVKPEPVETGMYPGHGQVTPIFWKNPLSTGQNAATGYKGFGRMVTVSEVALHLIATADGRPDNFSWVNVRGGRTFSSGGKTAQKIREGNTERVYEVSKPGEYNNQSGGIEPGNTWKRWYSNLPPNPLLATFINIWGCVETGNPSVVPNHINRHPAYNSANWNITLEKNTPLKDNEKRIQAMLQIETFVPSAGWTKYAPEFTLKLDPSNVASLRVESVNGAVQLFDTTNTEIKSNYRFMGGVNGMQLVEDINAVGGHYTPGALSNDRLAKGTGQMPDDTGYGVGSGVHGRIYDYPLVSKFFTVDRFQKIKFSSSAQLKINIYDSHSTQGDPVQTVAIKMPQNESETTLPMPQLVVYSTEKVEDSNNNGNYVNQPTVHACRWWCFNRDGAVNRFTGPYTSPRAVADVNLKSSTRGRLNKQPHVDVNMTGGKQITGGTTYGYSDGLAVKAKESDYSSLNDLEPGLVNSGGFTPGAGEFMGQYAYYGSDVVRSLIPRHGDYRIVAAKVNSNSNLWMPHPVWTKSNSALFAHSFTSFRSDTSVGYDTGVTREGVPNSADDDISKQRLVRGAWYTLAQVPDTPLDEISANLGQVYGDFDTGPGNMKDGAYINKPDDGNLSKMQVYHSGGNAGTGRGVYDYRNAYFTDSYLQVPMSGAFATPNKIVTSPVMFGSLPTGVWGSLSDNPDAATNGVPFRTLLFRPATKSAAGIIHTGGPRRATDNSATDPADHYLLDLFWMPVVEPYAISNNYASAGKININYQILPFKYIQRATGVYAALKGERVTAVSHTLTNKSDGSTQVPASRSNRLLYKTVKDSRPFPNKFWPENEMPVHLPINIYQTVQQINDFTDNFSGAFRTASQFCEIHLVPSSLGDAYIQGNRPGFNAVMSGFWSEHRLTGDNLKERPYANIYQKITNRSNTYRVHFIAQSIKKAKSVAPNQYSSGSDQVTGEFKGSALFERYLAVTAGNTVYPNYAAVADPMAQTSLEKFYRYRIIEMKQFVP